MSTTIVDYAGTIRTLETLAAWCSCLFAGLVVVVSSKQVANQQTKKPRYGCCEFVMISEPHAGANGG